MFSLNFAQSKVTYVCYKVFELFLVVDLRKLAVTFVGGRIRFCNSLAGGRVRLVKQMQIGVEGEF